jgi:lipopolysaccharide transport system permease protein
MQHVRHISSEQPLLDWLLQILARRETLRMLLWKDLKVQYGNIALGLLWAISQPLAYLLVIGTLLRFSSTEPQINERGHIAFLFAGIILWNFATSAVSATVNNVYANSSMISKVYFPRFYLVLAPVARSGLDFLLSFLLLIVLVLISDVDFHWISFWQIPMAFLLISITVLGLAAFAAFAVVRNRHIRHAIPMVMYAGLFMFPVFQTLQGIHYPILSAAYSENPIAASMNLLRGGMGMTDSAFPSILGASVGALVILFIGIWSFRRMELQIADRI